MSLIDDLIAGVDYPDAVVRDVRVGVGWTAVLSARCGVAKTYGIHSTQHVRIPGAGELIGLPAIEMAQFARSLNQLEASLGVAALNSMIEPKGEIGANAMDLFKEKLRGKRAVMVGRFPVEIRELVEAATDFWILELNPALIDESERVLPVTAAPSVLSTAEVVALTGSTLVTQSLEYYLSLCRNAYTIVLGPSTPLSEVLFRYGADVVAGIEVVNPDAVLAVISQGGGRMHPSAFGKTIRYRMLTAPTTGE